MLNGGHGLVGLINSRTWGINSINYLLNSYDCVSHAENCAYSTFNFAHSYPPPKLEKKQGEPKEKKNLRAKLKLLSDLRPAQPLST